MHRQKGKRRIDVAYLQVIAELDRSPFSELRSYTATDITPAFGPNLLQLVNNSKLEFKVTPAQHHESAYAQPQAKLQCGSGMMEQDFQEFEQ